jgi:HPt (histidine-containing phosphotransfer) domain-containing protein
MIATTTLSAHLDATVIADIRELGSPGHDVLADLMNIFVNEVAELLPRLSAAIAAGGEEAAWQIAHRLKGTALGMGAWQMAGICGAIEQAARGGALGQAAATAIDLVAEFECACLALKQEVGA